MQLFSNDHANGSKKSLYLGNEPLCTVETVMTRGGKGQNAWVGPDWPATKARAEHIAEALRHYQQSQEAEVTP